jgi:hypothetical protein
MARPHRNRVTLAIATLAIMAFIDSASAQPGQMKDRGPGGPPAARPAPAPAPRMAPAPQVAPPRAAMPSAPMAAPRAPIAAPRPPIAAPRAPMMARPAMPPRAMQGPGPALRHVMPPRHAGGAPHRAGPRFVAPGRPAARLAAPRGGPAMSRVERRTMQRQLATQPRIMGRDRAAARIEQRRAAGPSRLDRLQQRAERGRLSPVERRTLRRLEGAERRLPPAPSAQNDRAAARVEQRRNALQNRIERLQQRAERGRLSPIERRSLHRLERAQRLLPPQRQLPPALATGPRDRQATRDQQRVDRAARITPQQAMRGRFAANFANLDRGARRHDRARRLAARFAWRLGLFAPYVPWHGPVYWPYAYDDIFHYAFWPNAYEPGYWAYAYDDFYDGIFFPDGAPYVGYAYPGPYYQGAEVRGVNGRETTGSVRAGQPPGRVTQATRAFCAEQAKGITAWPFARIEQAVRPINNQKDLLADLRKAAADAAAQFRDACPDAVPLTPTGRLEAMTMRLQATLAAIKIVRPALAAFYESLEDEQKARFNEIGPDLEREPRNAQSAAQGNAANCKGAQASLAELPTERIDAIVRPTRPQEAGLTRLHDAIARSAAKLAEVCAAATPGTPVGRLDAMQQRVEAMIAAAEDIRPALDAFYASLDDEQKAKFNRLSRVSAQSRE